MGATGKIAVESEAAEAGSRPSRAAFYCVTDSRYFLGAVGMLNSLRLLGHTEPVFVLDCGLTPAQRELLSPHATLVPAPDDSPPWLLKTVAPLRHPAEVMVLIDADMIVTRPLTELIETASEGHVVAFENDTDRFFPEWGELLDLGPTRRQPYLSSGLVFLSGVVGKEVLRLMEDRQDRVDFDLTFWRANVRDYPFLYGDQCVLNAILATRVDPERVVALEHRLAPTPPFRQLRVVEERKLRCAYRDGVEPYVVHQYIRKPWLQPTYHGVYSQLLARSLLGADVPAKVTETEVPLRMRRGLRALAERILVNAFDLARWNFGDRLPAWLGDRIEDLRRRLAPGRL
jgi:hypothetical protein